MIKAFNVLLLCFLFSLFSCQNQEGEGQLLSELQSEESTPVEKGERRFVSAESGLNFRDAPRGKILGKFEYNQELLLVEQTGIKETIESDGVPITNEWVGVLHHGDIVYVFGGFLTITKDVSNIREENTYYVEVEDLIMGQLIRLKDSIELEEVDTDGMIKVEAISKAEFRNTYKQYHSRNVRKDIVKKDSSIAIACTGGKSIVFRDKYTGFEDEAEEFFYDQTFEAIHSHLLVMNGWEWSEQFLVDYQNCSSIRLNGYPIFNHDYSKVVAFNHDVGDEGVVINDFNEGKLEPRYRFEIYQSPERAVFGPDGKLYIELYSMWNDGVLQRQSYQFFRLEFVE